MTKKTTLACIMVSILFGSLLFFGCRAGVTQAANDQLRQDYAVAGQPQEKWDWVNEQWNGDNRPYQKTRQDITTALERGQDAGDLAEKYRLKALDSLKDPQAVFGWAYAVWEYTNTVSSSTESRLMWLRVREALSQPSSPHTYDYDRLRFVLAANRTYLRGLGERLLKQNPTDAPVKFQLIYTYIDGFGTSLLVSEGTASQLKAKALQLANELIESNPKDPDYRAALGSIYVAYFERHYQDKHYIREDAVKALAAWQEYQRIAKPGDDFYRESFTMSHSMKQYLDTGELK